MSMCRNGGCAHVSTNVHTDPTERSQRESRSTTGETAPHAWLPPEPVDKAVAPSQASLHSHGMSLIDGCPACVLNTEPPRSTVRLEQGWRCAYLCTDCGHAWTTDWRD